MAYFTYTLLENRKIMTIKKVQLSGDFKNWWETDLSKVLNIDSRNIITVVIEDGGVYLIYRE